MPGVERVRLSSVEVIHVRDSLLRALVEEPRGLPASARADAVRRRRRAARRWAATTRAAEYLAHVAAVRAAAPEVNVTTDVIVGFPSEDEAAFERTLAAVDAAGITRVHVFPYSPRPGTVAEGLGDAVAPAEKKRRSQVLRARSEVRSRHAPRRASSAACETRADRQGRAGPQCSGYTADYTRCYLPAGAGERGELVDVACDELHADGIRCSVAVP